MFPKSRLLTSRHAVLLLAILVLWTLPFACRAWEVVYDATTLPSDPSLGLDLWIAEGADGPPWASVADGILRIDSQTDGFCRFLLPSSRVVAAGPVTLEARVRVLSASHPHTWNFGLTAQVTNGGKGYVGLSPDGVSILDSDIVSRKHHIDMTSFRVLRIAAGGGSDGRSYSIAVDGTEVFYGVMDIRPANRIAFGSLYSSLSEWDYVAFSNDYLPVPEPSSLLALTGGLGLLAGLRRRKT